MNDLQRLARAWTVVVAYCTMMNGHKLGSSFLAPGGRLSQRACTVPGCCFRVLVGTSYDVPECPWDGSGPPDPDSVVARLLRRWDSQ